MKEDRKDNCIAIENKNAKYRVYIGDYKDYMTAVNVKKEMESRGIQCFIVKKGGEINE